MNVKPSSIFSYVYAIVNDILIACKAYLCGYIAPYLSRLLLLLLVVLTRRILVQEQRVLYSNK